MGFKRVLLLDEISTGLDSATTFHVLRCLQQVCHCLDATVLVSLLQPAPESFCLFDDVLLLSEGCVVFHGPREKVLPFFEERGFKCPERKGVADFLQEVGGVRSEGVGGVKSEGVGGGREGGREGGRVGGREGGRERETDGRTRG